MHIYLAEKGLELPVERVDIRKRSNRTPEFLARNPFGGIPVLELDDGSQLAESVAICRYLEALHPSPPLFGRTPQEIGRVEMWIRRLELYLMVPVGMVWIHGSPLTKAVMKRQIPEVAEQNRGAVARSFEIFDRELAGRAFFAGDAYSMADIVGLASLDFAIELNGFQVPEGARHLARLARRGLGAPQRGGGEALSGAVSLVPAGAADARVLARLLELYVHDLSEAFELELGPDGRFGYANLPRYFEEPERRFAFLIRAGEHLAGFALATRGSPASDDPDVLDLAEFFVVRRHRRAGVGRAAAFALWDRLPGRWVVRVADTNRRGLPFWSAAVPEYARGAFERRLIEGPRQTWNVFTFQSPRER